MELFLNVPEYIQGRVERYSFFVVLNNYFKILMFFYLKFKLFKFFLLFVSYNSLPWFAGGLVLFFVAVFRIGAFLCWLVIPMFRYFFRKIDRFANESSFDEEVIICRLDKDWLEWIGEYKLNNILTIIEGDD